MKILVTLFLLIALVSSGCKEDTVAPTKEYVYHTITTKQSDWLPYGGTFPNENVGWFCYPLSNGNKVIFSDNKEYKIEMSIDGSTTLQLPHTWKHDNKTYMLDMERDENGNWIVVYLPKDITELFRQKETVSVSIGIKEK